MPKFERRVYRRRYNVTLLTRKKRKDFKFAMF